MKIYTLFCLSLCINTPLYADISLYQHDKFSLNGNIDASMGYFTVDNPNFGHGRIDYFSGNNTGNSQWFEATFKPTIRATYTTNNNGDFYTGASSVLSITAGDGDAGGFTRSHTSIDIEAAYAGWRSGNIFSQSLGKDALAFSYGRQRLQIGDGLLIYDGNFDMGKKSAYWLAPRSAFEHAALAQLNTENYHSDLFFLKSDYTWENTALIGLNVERKNTYNGTIGAMYLHVLDSKLGLLNLVRDDMNVYSFNFSELSNKHLQNLKFWGNFIYEHGNGSQGKIEAFAWYLETQYQLNNIPWKPSLNYRYSHFSGDNNPNDNTNNNFDALFYGYSRGWGTWYQGEIVGTYLLFNSNMRTHMLKLSASPLENLTVGTIYYHFDLDKNYYYSTPVTSRNFADEIDIYADFNIGDYATISASYAVAIPNEAGQQAIGNNKTSQLFEVLLFLYF